MQDDRLAKAEEAFRHGQYSDVVALLADQPLASLSVRAIGLLGAAHSALGDWAEAERIARYLTERDPANPRWWSNWGTALRKLGRYREARTAQRKALELSPGYERAHTELRKIARDERQSIHAAASDVSVDAHLLNDAPGEPRHGHEATGMPPPTTEPAIDRALLASGGLLLFIGAFCPWTGLDVFALISWQLHVPLLRLLSLSAGLIALSYAVLGNELTRPSARWSLLSCMALAIGSATGAGVQLIVNKALGHPGIGTLAVAAGAVVVVAALWPILASERPVNIGLLFLGAMLLAGIGTLATSTGNSHSMPVPTPTAPTANIFGGSQGQKRPKVELRLRRWWTTDRLIEGTTIHRPGAGRTFLIADVEAINKGQSEIPVIAPAIQLIASDKNVYPAAGPVWPDGLPLLAADLLPGGRATGCVIFEVPIGVTPVRLRHLVDAF